MYVCTSRRRHCDDPGATERRTDYTSPRLCLRWVKKIIINLNLEYFYFKVIWTQICAYLAEIGMEQATLLSGRTQPTWIQKISKHFGHLAAIRGITKHSYMLSFSKQLEFKELAAARRWGLMLWHCLQQLWSNRYHELIQGRSIALKLS